MTSGLLNHYAEWLVKEEAETMCDDTVVTAMDPANPDMGNIELTHMEAIHHLVECVHRYHKAWYDRSVKLLDTLESLDAECGFSDERLKEIGDLRRELKVEER